VNVNLDEAVKTAEQAVAYAQENQAAEQAWYEQYCSGQ
jgi:hypothetical protein